MHELIVEGADGWSLLSDATRIDQIQLDFRFSLVLDGGMLIAIGGRFVATIDGMTCEVEPETLEGVPGVLSVLHRDLLRVDALRTGELRLILIGGDSIEVAVDAQYENWQIVLADRSQLIGLPGGGVAVHPGGR